jgi:hypothetical protein
MEEEIAFLKVTCYSKFSKEAEIFMLGEFMFATVEFMRSKKTYFLSNVCKRPGEEWKGLRDYGK